MRRTLTLILLGAVFLTFGFGAFLMLHKDGEAHSACVTGVIGGVRCETAMRGAASAILHLRALTYPVVVPVLAVFAILFFALAFLSVYAPPKPAVISIRFPQLLRDLEDVPAERELRAWLSIHEKRDPSSIAAVNA